MRAIFFAACGAALFAGSELGLRDFYGKMETAGERNQIFTLKARISSPVATAYSSYRFRCKVTGADNAELESVLKGKTLQCVSRGPVPPYGEITMQGVYSPPRRAAGPLGFDQREHFAVSGIHGNFLVSRALEKSLLTGKGHFSSDDKRQPSSPNKEQSPQTLSERLSPDNIAYALRSRVHEVTGRASNENVRGIFHAAFLNERDLLSPELNTMFRKAGIVHLLAISGFHAALLYSAIFAALGLFAIPPRYRTFLSLAALWCYLFFIGFIPSLFRATVMVTFFCVSMTLQRKNHAVHSLGIAGVLWLFISPHSLFSPGFQLSFAATAGIIMFQPVFSALTKAIVEKIHSKPVGFIVDRTLSPFWVSVVGFAATAPTLLHYFGTVSLYGIFFNVIAIPLMSAAMWIFFAALVLSPIGVLCGAAVWCAEKTLGLMITLSGFSERIPLSEVVVPHTAAAQLAVMTVFMFGLCGIKKELRGLYTLRAGGAAALVIAAFALHLSMTAKTENLEFRRDSTTVNVIIHKDNSAWIAAQGGRNAVRQLRTREVEPLLYRKKVRSVPLFLVNEESEEEAHEFTFTTEYNPRIVVLRKYRKGDERSIGFYDEGYQKLTTRTLISPTGACSLWINDDGRAEIIVKN